MVISLLIDNLNLNKLSVINVMCYNIVQICVYIYMYTRYIYMHGYLFIKELVLSHICIYLFAVLYKTHLFLSDVNTLGDLNYTGIFTTNVLRYAL